MQVVTFQAATASTVPFLTSVSPNTGPVAGGTAVTITGRLRDGRDGDVRNHGGDQCGGGEQHDDHGDDAGGQRGCGDGDSDRERAERKPVQWVHLCCAADGDQRQSEQRIDGGRNGGNHHRDQLRLGSDGDVRSGGSDQRGGSKQHDDHGHDSGGQQPVQ